MSRNQSLLQLKGITKIFSRGTVDEVRALDNINLDVNADFYCPLKSGLLRSKNAVIPSF